MSTIEETKTFRDTNGLSECELPEAARDIYDLPTKLFEMFITDKIVDEICKEIIFYAAQNGGHSFKMDHKAFNSFTAVLLLSGYILYPRRYMY